MSTRPPLALQDANLPLTGKVALVTGGSRGIGWAIAHRIGRLGASVAICARKSADLDRAAAELRDEGIRCMGIEADVTRPEDVQRMIEQTSKELGEIEILVNNAGIGVFGPFYERTDNDWHAVVDTNLKAAFLTSKAVAPGMIRPRRGHIINISSLASKSAFAGGAIYCASKWGLMGLTSCMAEDLRAHGIRVSVVCPGSVATEFSSHAGRNPRTLLHPDDVAYAVGTLLTQGPQSFISEIDVRPLRKT
jgi:3-oxoacyl-[acyl-carrier protein] reductase